jgi:hypothetical protein
LVQSVCIFLDLGFNFHLEFRQYKFRSLPWFACVNKLNLLYCLNKTFSSYSYIFSIEYFVNQIYHKTEIICKKRMIYKKETRRLISLSSRRRATSADIGREFHPLRLVWWALLIKEMFDNPDLCYEYLTKLSMKRKSSNNISTYKRLDTMCIKQSYMYYRQLIGIIHTYLIVNNKSDLNYC